MMTWSRMRLWTLISSTALTLTLLGVPLAAYIYTGDPETNTWYWLGVFAASLGWIGFIAATVQATLQAKQEEILARINEIGDRIVDFGDEREAIGEKTAMKYVHGSGHGSGRRLVSIGTDDN